MGLCSPTLELPSCSCAVKPLACPPVARAKTRSGGRGFARQGMFGLGVIPSAQKKQRENWGRTRHARCPRELYAWQLWVCHVVATGHPVLLFHLLPRWVDQQARAWAKLSGTYSLPYTTMYTALHTLHIQGPELCCTLRHIPSINPAWCTYTTYYTSGV